MTGWTRIESLGSRSFVPKISPDTSSGHIMDQESREVALQVKGIATGIRLSKSKTASAKGSQFVRGGGPWIGHLASLHTILNCIFKIFGQRWFPHHLWSPAIESPSRHQSASIGLFIHRSLQLNQHLKFFFSLVSVGGPSAGIIVVVQHNDRGEPAVSYR